MLLYKSRGFSEFFQDTFGFLKSNGKHFFKHFFIINGAFLMILMILGYFFSKFYTQVVFGGLLNNDTEVVDNYMNDNFGLFMLFFFTFVIVGIIAALIQYAFTAIYLQLYTKQDQPSFGTTEIINSYKKYIGKLFIFLICGILIGIPLLAVFGIVGFILTITIIGILGLPLLLGAFMLFYNMTLMEYIEGKKSIWDCFGYAWELMKLRFWAAVGCVGLFFLMTYIVQNIVSIIPYFFGLIKFFTTIENGNSPNPQELQSSMMIMMVLVFVISFTLGTILNTIVQLNQGIIFYSLKEDKEHINTKDIIDQIGLSE